MSKILYNYKRAAIRAARELGYSTSVIDALKLAQTEGEIARIMTNARKGLVK